MVQGHFLQMGGFSLSCNSDEHECLIKTPFQTKTNDDWEGALLDNDFISLINDGILEMPVITEEVINDRSKADAFSKGIALLQSIWFITQIIARHVQNMAITELELTTLALVVLNSVMYICWWYKPLDVETTIVLTPPRLRSESDIPPPKVVVEDLDNEPAVSSSSSAADLLARVTAVPMSLFRWPLVCIRSSIIVGESYILHVKK